MLASQMECRSFLHFSKVFPGQASRELVLVRLCRELRVKWAGEKFILKCFLHPEKLPRASIFPNRGKKSRSEGPQLIVTCITWRVAHGFADASSASLIRSKAMAMILTLSKKLLKFFLMHWVFMECLLQSRHGGRFWKFKAKRSPGLICETGTEMPAVLPYEKRSGSNVSSCDET